MNPTTFHTDPQTVTLAIIAVVLPFAAFAVNFMVLVKNKGLIGVTKLISLLGVLFASSLTKSYAQEKSVYVRTDSPAVHFRNKPLYLVDGNFAGDIANILPNDIIKIDVENNRPASAVLGSLGRYGIVNITTKQREDKAYQLTLDSALKRRHLFVVDGVALDSLVTLVPGDVYEVVILDANKISSQTAFSAFSDVILIITKSGAQSKYIKGLSKRSGRYKRYINRNNNTDDGLTYIVDNKVLDAKEPIDQKIELLALLSAKDITSMKFVYEAGYLLPSNISLPAVVIHTKQSSTTKKP